MKIYQVGGAVRDEILNLPVQDRDYVVVGGQYSRINPKINGNFK